MEFFFLFTWIFVVAFVAFAQNAGNKRHKYSISTKPTEVEENKIVYDFKGQQNPESYYEEKEQEFLVQIKEMYESIAKTYNFSKYNKTMREIEKLKRKLANLRAQYKEYVASTKYQFYTEYNLTLNQNDMEYKDMIEKVKALAIKNREAKTAEEKALIKEQMERLKAEDEKAFAVAVGFMVKKTKQDIEEQRT